MNDILGRVHMGDAVATMKKWPDAFVDATVTSPPYWQHRDYLPANHKFKVFEMGGEQSITRYLEDQMVVFKEVLRLTKPGGTCFVNIGDKVADKDTRKVEPGYAEGEPLGIPWRFAEAMRNLVGWRLASEIIWAKPNPIPGIRTRAPVCSHEHVFVFSKGPGYWDGHAICDRTTEKRRKAPTDEPATVETTRQPRSVWTISVGSLDGRKLLADFREDGNYLEVDAACPLHGDNPRGSAGPLFGPDPEDCACSCHVLDASHFAAMPLELAERCILAGTSEVGCCTACGAAYRRLVRKTRIATRPGLNPTVDPEGRAHRDPQRHVTRAETDGWEKSCNCEGGIGQPVPAVVFDPFAGSGTTPAVAEALGRRWLATELHPVFALKLAPARIAKGYERKFPA